jgi:cell division septum initiation protein DivIVA
MTTEERIHQLEDKNKKLKSVIKELKEKLQKYSDYKTLNDNVIKEVIETANHV